MLAPSLAPMLRADRLVVRTTMTTRALRRAAARLLQRHARIASSARWALLWLLVLITPQTLHAHAGPQVRDIRPPDAKHGELLVSNRGLIQRSSSDAAWQLMCNEALGVSTVELPELAELEDGRLLAATVRGLQSSQDRGCSWQAVPPFADLTLPSLSQHPTQPDRIFITSYGAGQSGLSVTDDGGAHWQTLLKVEDSDYLRFIRICQQQPEHIYVRSLRFGSGSAFVYAVLHSSDAGQTWQRHAVDVTDSETDFVILGVSPDDPTFVIAKAEAGNPADPERLLVSHDAGEHFSEALRARVITAVTWSGDGKRSWVAADEGLFRSDDDGRSFERVGGAEYVSCVVERDAELLACGFYRGVSAGHPGIGVSHDGGETFEHWMQLNEVMQPLECPADSATAGACAPLWTDWQREILGTLDGTADAGMPDASTFDAAALDAANGGQGPADARASGPETAPPTAADAMADSDADTDWRGGRGNVGCGCRVITVHSVRWKATPRVVSACLAACWLGLIARRRARSRRNQPSGDANAVR